MHVGICVCVCENVICTGMSGHGNTQAPHCVNAPSEADLDTFFKTINGAKHKPGILKVVPPYADQFVPLSFTSLLPPLLTDLYEPEYLQMDYLSLLQKCEDIVKTLKVRIIMHT